MMRIYTLLRGGLGADMIASYITSPFGIQKGDLVWISKDIQEDFGMIVYLNTPYLVTEIIEDRCYIDRVPVILHLASTKLTKYGVCIKKSKVIFREPKWESHHHYIYLSWRGRVAILVEEFPIMACTQKIPCGKCPIRLKCKSQKWRFK